MPGDPSWASHLLTRGPQGELQGVRVFGSNSLGPTPPAPGPHLSPVLFVPVLGHPSWGPCHCPGLRSTLCRCGPLSCLLGHRPGLPRQGTRGLTCPGRGGGPWPRARSVPGKGPGGDVRQRRGRGVCSRAQSVADGRSALFPLLRGPAASARGWQVTAAWLGVCVRGGISRFWVPSGCSLPAELRFVCLRGNKPCSLATDSLCALGQGSQGPLSPGHSQLGAGTGQNPGRAHQPSTLGSLRGAGGSLLALPLGAHSALRALPSRRSQPARERGQHRNREKQSQIVRGGVPRSHRVSPWIRPHRPSTPLPQRPELINPPF